MTCVFQAVPTNEKSNAINRAALAAVSRPFQFNLCIWGAANVWEWGAKVVRVDLPADYRFALNTLSGTFVENVGRFEVFALFQLTIDSF